MSTIDEKLLLKQRFLNGCVPTQEDYAKLIDFFVPYKKYYEDLLVLEEKVNALKSNLNTYKTNTDARINELHRFINELQMSITTPSSQEYILGTDFKLNEPISLILSNNTTIPSIRLYKGSSESSLDKEITELPSNLYSIQYNLSEQIAIITVKDGLITDEKLFIYY